MKKLIILGAFLFSINSLNAQTSTNYEEASNPISTNPSLWVKVSAPPVSWGSTDIRYKKEEPATIARLKKDIKKKIRITKKITRLSEWWQRNRRNTEHLPPIHDENESKRRKTKWKKPLNSWTS